MDSFLERFGSRVLGTISCFDRLIFKGTLRTLNRADAMDHFLAWKRVLLKDFGAFVESQSAVLKEHARALAENAGCPHEHLYSSSLSKEVRAREYLKKRPDREGLVCIFRSVEPCYSFGIKKNATTKKLELVYHERKCLFLYFYYLDPVFGLIHLRLQTWFPFDIQVWINGHEWLARALDIQGIRYERQQNCFTWIQDFQRAQKIADDLLRTNWPSQLNLFAKRINPLLGGLLRGLKYFWTIRQGEYSTDVVFRNTQALDQIYPNFIDHAITCFHSETILRFLGQRAPNRVQGDVTSRRCRRPEGVCIHHSAWENDIKMYNKHGNVLRIETTINNPRRFMVFRRVYRKGKCLMLWVPMRKGVADIHRRVQISRAANARYLQALASTPEKQSVREVLDPVSRPRITPTQRFRGLRPIGPEDSRLFAGILRGEGVLNGFRNADIRRFLFPSVPNDLKQRKRQAGRAGRCLRLLREHGLIRKLPRTTRYMVTTEGHRVMGTATYVRDANVYALAIA